MYNPEGKLTPEQLEILSENAEKCADMLNEKIKANYKGEEGKLIMEMTALIGIAFATSRLPPPISPLTAKALRLMAEAMEEACKTLPQEILRILEGQDVEEEKPKEDSPWH